jgi:hypothetical protein
MLCKVIQKLEKLQQRATKYILQDYSTDYKLRLLSLNLLLLMMVYELNDIMFLSTTTRNPLSPSTFPSMCRYPVHALDPTPAS